MSRKKAKLPPVPRHRPGRRSDAAATGSPVAAVPNAPPDLSHIAEALRPLAVPVAGLSFDPANARTHGDKNLDGIRGSLAAYGQVKPVVARRDTGVVIAGNGTLQAALSLGWTHLAAVLVDFTDAKAAGFSVADNRTAELAGWDQAALDALLRECDTGNDERLDAMLSELAAEVGIIPPDEQEAKPPAADPPEEAQPARITCPSCGHQFDGTIKVTEAPAAPPPAG